jgi:hypothetical protein
MAQKLDTSLSMSPLISTQNKLHIYFILSMIPLGTERVGYLFLFSIYDMISNDNE